MTYTEEGHYSVTSRGATRERRQTFSAEALLKRLMDAMDNPHSWEERNAIKEKVMAILHSKEGRKYIDTVIEGWFQNAYRRLLQSEYPIDGRTNGKINGKINGKAAAGKRKQVEQAIDQAIDRKVELKLLDLIMTNGKRLRDCSGRECARMSVQTGKWLGAIARRVKPKEIVGNVLDEAAVRKLYTVAK